MLVHRDGRVIYANAAAVKLLGARTTAELEARPLLELIHPASHPLLLARLNVATSQGHATPLAELRCRRLDGGVIDVQAQSIATTYDGAKVTITYLHVVHAGQNLDGVARLGG